MDVAWPQPFAELLRHHRRAAGLSQEALAEQARLSPRAVSALEQGTRLAPHRDSIQMLSAALHLSPDERAALEAAVGRKRRPSSPVSGAASSPAYSLPVQPTALIGREREVAAVATLLRRPRVHLLTPPGPGGVGKTRLGLQVAAEVLADFADGVVWVALAAVQVPDLLAPAILDALGVRDVASLQPQESLIAYLAGKQVLLLLDTFEHLAPAAPLVATLLAACPRLKILVTSRAALRVRGEAIVPVARWRCRPSRTSATSNIWPGAHRCASLWSGPRRYGRPFSSRPQMRPPWPRSAGAWRGCRWPSSWRRLASRCCRPRPCWLDWSSGSRC